jgi:hypothetical protein
MSLYVDIGQGTGLAGASGVRPFLPPLLAGAMARGDLALDFDGSGWGFLESPVFLLAVLALAVLWYGAERSWANRSDEGDDAAEIGRRELPQGSSRPPLELAVVALGLVLGALLFAGSLAAGGHEGWPGLIAGVPCAALGWAAVGGLFGRARERLEDGGAGLLSVYADGVALVLAAVAILLPPVSFLALGAFLLLVVKARGERDRKYAGLRVLR